MALSAFDGMLVGEELNWGCSGIGTSIGANGLGSGPVILAGTDEQKAAGCRRCSSRRSSARSGSPSPAPARTSRACRRRRCVRGDEYVLNGSKTFITNAGYAAWTVVFAKTDPAKGHRGISAFIVPMDTPGVTIEQHLDKMGQRSTDTSAFALQDVVVPAANRLGAEGEGFKIAMRTLDFTRPGTAAGAVGVAQAAYELRGRVREGARHVRRADRDAPGRQLHDRRHGDRDRGGAPAHLAGGVAARPGRARDAALVVRQALRRRHGDEGHDRRRPGLRRLRLHEGVPGREADARREALPDLRGHLADPAARDREGDLHPARTRNEVVDTQVGDRYRCGSRRGCLVVGRARARVCARSVRGPGSPCRAGCCSSWRAVVGVAFAGSSGPPRPRHADRRRRRRRHDAGRRASGCSSDGLHGWPASP